MVALVDDSDYLHLSQFNWYFNKGYAIRVTSRKSGHKIIKMHREIMDALRNSIPVDHIDRNKLNNQKSNLRFTTVSENIINSGLYCNNTSGYKGIFWHKNKKKWQVFYQRNNKIIYVGLFSKKYDAIKARQSFEK